MKNRYGNISIQQVNICEQESIIGNGTCLVMIIEIVTLVKVEL